RRDARGPRQSRGHPDRRGVPHRRALRPRHEARRGSAAADRRPHPRRALSQRRDPRGVPALDDHARPDCRRARALRHAGARRLGRTCRPRPVVRSDAPRETHIAMTWARRYVFRSYLRSSLWIVPVTASLAEMLTIRIMRVLDDYFNWVPAAPFSLASAQM